jgi:NTP pyrophosphatase (non-canonical NTP hydrolase)
MKKTFDEVIEDLKAEERKDELTASPVEHRVMSLAFMAECVKKFERRAEGKNRTLKPWEDNSTEFLCKRQVEEVRELIDAADGGDPKAIMDECLDVANFAWFIYEQAKVASEVGA